MGKKLCWPVIFCKSKSSEYFAWQRNKCRRPCGFQDPFPVWSQWPHASIECSSHQFRVVAYTHSTATGLCVKRKENTIVIPIRISPRVGHPMTHGCHVFHRILWGVLSEIFCQALGLSPRSKFLPTCAPLQNEIREWQLWWWHGPCLRNPKSLFFSGTFVGVRWCRVYSSRPHWVRFGYCNLRPKQKGIHFHSRYW